MTESGVTVFGPFAADTDYFAADKTFMLNFRSGRSGRDDRTTEVRGHRGQPRSEMEGIGRFARFTTLRGTRLSFGRRWGEVWTDIGPGI